MSPESDIDPKVLHQLAMIRSRSRPFSIDFPEKSLKMGDGSMELSSLISESDTNIEKANTTHDIMLSIINREIEETASEVDVGSFVFFC